MGLTPVRIRSKRKFPSRDKPSPGQSMASLSDDKINPPKRMKRSLSNVLASRSTRWRPAIQALPAEILESIFLYSANVALPRSAPIIGSKLSGRATLIRFIIWAFQDTWEQSFGDPEKFAAIDKNRVSGNWQLQSTILCLPWITAEFILQAQQTWVEKYAREQHYRHYLPRLDDDGDPFIYGHSHHFEGGVGHFNSQECFEADYQEVLSWKPFERVGSWGGCDVHPKVRIPTTLITGPWDEKNLRLLFWLRRGGLVYGLEEHDRSWEIQLDCVRNAFIDAPEPNVFITNLFDLTALCQGLPRDVAREQRRRIDQRLKWGADSVISKEILRQVYGTIGMFHDGFGTSSSPK
ncbi:hypothetical protein H9Q69_013861 [Fusarium xylarioides]|nr:hypothetical protein H9Q70_006358 [Fusarium xylarioides]KAG5780034.1 hypothetical protein H9Q73_006294 [Fusarium xylarioides]KAG5787065.1 hypothetical protein H9Q69_013861 [Fusarium xylarioides]KAG5802311.1 hypothetical protein H9Q71_013101 [Fusarium xylarioides]KAG5812213.1 hypothetical protein H9Q74_013224 [Fusarium xylarioides]